MSKARSEHAGGMFDRPGRLLTGAAVLVFPLWCGFTAGFKLQEVLVGFAATALTVLFFANVLRSETLSVSLRARDLARLWRLPGDILRDCGVLVVVLVRDLVGIERAGSFYRACGFSSSRHDPLLVGRSALAVASTSMSPNVVVIGIDPTQSLMVFHQLQRQPVSELTRGLGGQR